MNLFDQAFPTLNEIGASGWIKQQPADFQVHEHNNIEYTGQGEHWWLYLEKTAANTTWAAAQIARAAQVSRRQVGYAGLKDRHAITRQWFSVQLPKVRTLPELQAELPPNLQVIEDQWHQSKLKTGGLSHNHFILTIRNIQGDQQQVEDHIQVVKTRGVPNYFGPQRFGHGMNNINRVQDWFQGRCQVNNKQQRSLLLSTARSYLFNLTVAHRIKQALWDQVIAGDLLQLDGSHSWFAEAQAQASELNQRLADHDIHLTGPLWGDGPLQSSLACAELEQSIADQHPIYLTGLAQRRLSQDRRPLRLIPQCLEHQWQGDDLRITVNLPPGSYATVLLRELLAVQAAEQYPEPHR